jgi:8-oxo-dGTP pyrophosphatase MutT (NUDIX family)
MNTTAYQGTYFSIRLDKDGNEYVDVRESEVLIVPLTGNGEVMLSIEPSPAFGEPTLILPGGSIEPLEVHGATAARELQEEIGYSPGRLDFLGELRPFSKYLTARSFIYLAHDLMPSRLKGDEDYFITCEQVPLASFEQLIAIGRLLDARVIASLYMARNFLQTHS